MGFVHWEDFVSVLATGNCFRLTLQAAQYQIPSNYLVTASSFYTGLLSGQEQGLTKLIVSGLQYDKLSAQTRF